MIKLLMSGCNGKMGQVITRLCSNSEIYRIAAGVTSNPDRISNPYPVYDSFEKVTEKIDVVIDFSNPSSLASLLDYCKKNKTALVVATTGLSEDDYKEIDAASQQIPIFLSANMSLGVNVIIDLALNACNALIDGFDIEIIEKHHNEKKDSPSGTALMIAKEINSHLDNKMQFIYDRSASTKKRERNEIGISAVRGGTIPGEHTILFAGKDEIVEIKHTALSRDIFGIGALKAASHLYGRESGIYNMKTLLKELI